MGDPDVDLTKIDLSNLRLTDCVVPDLGKALYHMGRLQELDLSYNTQLSCRALADLLSACSTHNCPIATLHLRGCHQVWSKDQVWSKEQVWSNDQVWSEDDSSVFLSAVADRLKERQMKHLVVPDRKDTGHSGQLRQAWDQAWGGRSRHRVDHTGHLVLTLD